MTDYKNLNLDRDAISTHVASFLEAKDLSTDGNLKDMAFGKRLVFGRPGSEFATLDIYFIGDGTTTLHWKVGRNHELSMMLAEHLKSTIDPAEFESVNLTLRGMVKEDVDPLLDLLASDEEIDTNIYHDDAKKKQIQYTNKKHKDNIVVTHHIGTRTLQIQGRPLSCYRRLVYLLTGLLDLGGLEKVLYRQEEDTKGIVRKEMAEDYLKISFPRSYELLPESVKKLLISSCCVRLASPNLPDYCMLLYPELRALEGILKEAMSGYSMSVSDADDGFGEFFQFSQGRHSLKADYASNVAHKKMEDALNEAYCFYNKHRHSLFHMEEFPDGSRMIDTLPKLISLSKEAYRVIDQVYTARM